MVLVRCLLPVFLHTKTPESSVRAALTAVVFVMAGIQSICRGACNVLVIGASWRQPFLSTATLPAAAAANRSWPLANGCTAAL